MTRSQPTAVTIDATVLFDYRKSELTPDAQANLERNIVARLAGLARIESITVSGHTDRIASELHNIKLSRARALAVKAYLAARGASASNIGVFGFGETQPVKSCPDVANRDQLIECLAPNRRAVVQVKGWAN